MCTAASPSRRADSSHQWNSHTRRPAVAPKVYQHHSVRKRNDHFVNHTNTQTGRAGYWQQHPQSVDGMLTPSAIIVLDCIRILVVTQAKKQVYAECLSVAPTPTLGGGTVWCGRHSISNKPQYSSPSIIFSLLPKRLFVELPSMYYQYGLFLGRTYVLSNILPASTVRPSQADTYCQHYCVNVQQPDHNAQQPYRPVLTSSYTALLVSATRATIDAYPRYEILI